MPRSKILFATDFGPEALPVLAQVELLASRQNAKVLLMHAPSAWRAWMSSGSSERQAEDRLKGWGEKLEAKGLEVEVSVARGSAAERILEAAEVWNADLIAIGAGEGWREGHTVGTTAQTVVRHALRSVWVGVPTPRPIQRILCGFDGSERGREALECALELSEQLSAKLTVMGALEGPPDNLLGTSPAEEKELLESYKRERRNELEQAVREVAGNEAPECTWVWGRGSDVLQAKAHDDDFDVIVLGRTGVGQVRRALLGTTAERLLRNTPCSLYVVGRQADEPAES